MSRTFEYRVSGLTQVQFKAGTYILAPRPDDRVAGHNAVPASGAASEA
jgi:hypothetical protein